MSKPRYDSYDIVVVGAGLVGSALASRLGRWAERTERVLRIALIESHENIGCYKGEQFDPRVVALTEASRRLLDSLGLWETVRQARVCPFTRMEVWDGEGIGHIEFDCAEVRTADLGHIVENSVICMVLCNAIASLANVDYICPASVQSLSVEGQSDDDGENRQIQTHILHLNDGRKLRASLVVGADGAQSRIRKLGRMETREWAYGHRAIIATIRTERPHGYVARQRFTADGTLAFLPLQNDGDCHYTSLVWSQREKVAERLMELDDAEFCSALTRASERCLGDVEAVAQRFSIPLRQRHALQYARPGLVLLGDAAHTIHPLAGQGVNLGFKDVEALAEELERAIPEGVNPGHARVLQRYQRRRKPDNLAMMAVMEGFKRLFETDIPRVRILRNFGLSQVNKIDLLKRLIIRRAMGL